MSQKNSKYSKTGGLFCHPMFSNPERLRGVTTTRRYTNLCLPYLTL